MKWVLLFSPFNIESKAYGDQVTCPKSHNVLVFYYCFKKIK